MTWQLAIFLAVILSSFCTIILKKSLSKLNSNPVLFSTYSQIIIAVIIGTFATVIGKFTVMDTFRMLPNLILTTVLYGMANIFVIKALGSMEASKYVVIFGMRGLIATFLSILIFNEQISVITLFGSLLVVFSVVLINWEKKVIEGNKSSLRSIMYAFLAALFVGSSALNDKVAIQHTNFYYYSFLAYLLPGVFTYFVYFKDSTKGLVKVLPKIDYLKNIVLLSVLSSITGVLYFYAILKVDQVSKVTSIGVSNVILIVLLSYFLLNDRKHKYKKIIASVICFSGLYLLS